MQRALLISICWLVATVPAWAQAKRPITVDDLFKFKRVADPQISPDGKQVAYVMTSVDLPGNKTSSAIWLVSTEGGGPRQLTNTIGKKDRHPRWSPDGKSILFESNRSGENQIWLIDLTGGEARQLTTISTEASNAIWSPDGTRIAFVSAVYPEYSEKPFKESDALNKKRKEEIAKNPVKAKVFTRLFFRHWDEYVEDKRQHLFVLQVGLAEHESPVSMNPKYEPTDVTPGDRDAYPTSTTFSVGDDFTFSPDGRFLVFTAVPEKDEAWSTNYDICRVPITGGTTQWECLTKDNPAADSCPRFSPDGKWLAYRAQKRPGFEADQWNVRIDEYQSARKPGPLDVIYDLPISVDTIFWRSKDALMATGEKETRTALHEINIGDKKGMHEFQFGPEMRGTLSAVAAVPTNVRHETFRPVVLLRATLQGPPEIVLCHVDNTEPGLRKLTRENEALLAELDLPQAESVDISGADGIRMQMWILKPPGFDEKKRWPLVYLVHGGPQGAWDDNWSYRWNPQVWAAQGYVVAMPNPRGSTGFGQKYVDEISGDWGGKCYVDLMKGVEYLEKLPYIDKDRMAAAGASFGGYMMNWFAGHTDKFKTLITHCGVYNFDSMYALTEELWFDEWEHGGPPWIKRDSYEKHSPHKFAKNFKTPMLIIHNDLDFRVPVSEGLQLFTTLQRLGVPSRMVNFPDEGHWVLKPANSKYWHEEVFTWLKKYAPPGGK